MAGCAWFCCGVIAFYFINDPELAILLFHSLRLGMTLHTRTQYWPAIYVAEWGLAIALALLLDELTVNRFNRQRIKHSATLFAKRYYYGDQNRLVVMASIIMVTSLINVAVVGSRLPATYIWCG
ncbi:hypothetical protein O9993_09765 [Vibrio lentus]|nr:hypothetical protein [Vibrio lentus]